MSQNHSSRGASSDILRIGEFTFDRATGILSNNSLNSRLAKQPQALLELLNENAGELVSRAQICEHLWPNGQMVDFDQSLNACVRKLRKCFEGDKSVAIETIPGRGYRLIVKAEQSAPGYRFGFWLKTAAIAVIASVVILNADLSAFDPPPVSIAVSKFTELSSRPPGSLGISLREEVLSALSRFSTKRIHVLVDEASLYAEGRAPEYKLIGNIRQQEASTRVSIRLVDKNGRQVWNQDFNMTHDSGLVDQQNISSQIVQQVANQLDLELPDQVKNVFELSHTIKTIFDHGLYLASQPDRVSQQKAMGKFEQVIAQEPTFPRAYFVLAEVLQNRAGSSKVNQADNFSRAMALVKQGLDLDPRDAKGYRILAYISFYRDRDIAESKRYLDRAFSYAPNSAKLHSLYAAWYSVSGAFAESIASAKLAQSLDPLSMSVNADLCWYFNFARQFATAKKTCESSLELAPNSSWTLFGLIESLRQQDQLPAAIKRSRVFPLFAEDSGKAIVNPSQELEQYFTTLLQAFSQAYSKNRASAYMIAALHAQLGDLKQTMIWLEKSLQDKDGFLIFVAVDSRFSSIENRSEFTKFLLRLKLSAKD